MPLESVFDSATQPVHFDPAALRHDLFDSTPALLNVLRTFDPWLADMRGKLFRAEFKRRQEPLSLYVSHVPFGGGWQTPVAGRFSLPEN